MEEGGSSLGNIWKPVLDSLVASKPHEPLEQIHTYLEELTNDDSHHGSNILSSVNVIDSIQYSDISNDSFNDQVYTIYTHLTDESSESLLRGIPCHIYEEFISHYISTEDELLKEPLRIILYSHHEPCVSYGSLRRALIGTISAKEYYRLARELYHSVTMTANLAQVIMNQLSEMTPWQSLNINLENVTDEKEFIKMSLKLFYQQYTQYEEN